MVYGCFSFKHLASRSQSLAEPLIDDLYFIDKDMDITVKDSNVLKCAALRSGSSTTKSVDGLDVNGLFGSVCVHGFPYKILDIVRGESAEYVAAIVK